MRLPTTETSGCQESDDADLAVPGGGTVPPVDVRETGLELSDELPSLSTVSDDQTTQLGPPILPKEGLAEFVSRTFRCQRMASLLKEDSPSNVRIYLLDTVNHAGLYGKIQDCCKRVGVPVSVEFVKPTGTMEEYVLCILRCIVEALKYKDKTFYLCFPHTLYSDGPVLKELVSKVKAQCRNVRMISTAACVPVEPLDGDVVTYLTNNEREASARAAGSFLIPHADARSLPLNILLGVVMIKLACCGDKSRIETACEAWE